MVVGIGLNRAGTSVQIMLQYPHSSATGGISTFRLCFIRLSVFDRWQAIMRKAWTTGNDPTLPLEDLRTAEERWRKLPRHQRREVLRLSRQGRVHPDRRVAEIAYRWARAKVYAGEHNILAKPSVAIPMALAVLPFGGSGAIVQYWKTLNAARRIVRASENDGQSTAAGDLR
jgi:hypothetical protein